MNSLSKLFLGVFLLFATAWVGLVALPYKNLGFLQPEVNEEEGIALPQPPPGLAALGSRVYAAEGCMYCHTQQVRPEWAGSDIERGWGLRRTVPRDYIFSSPVFLGTMRTGPDLANIGVRQTEAAWFHKHLYAPRLVRGAWSTMPAYRHLYDVRKINGQRSDQALDLGGAVEVPEGHEIVPTDRAVALVQYLLSLNRSYSLQEAPAK